MNKTPHKKCEIVMVFGVFDLFHRGHLSFLEQARKYGNVVAVVARDKTVLHFKKKKPRHNERTRLAKVASFSGVSRALLGDKQHGAYVVIKKIKPDIICLGYDQTHFTDKLATHIKEMGWNIEIRRLNAYKPEQFHSSIINK